MGEVSWHNPPRPMIVIWLSGEVEFETSDGDIRGLPQAASSRRKTLPTGRGYISRRPREGQLVAHIELA